MRSRDLLVIAGIGMLLAGPAMAQNAPDFVPDTLAGALAAAYADNPQLQEERAHLRSVDENVPTALAGWRPQIALSGQIGYGQGTTSEAFPNGFGSLSEVTFPLQRDLANGQATVTQYIYHGGRTTSSTHQAVNTVYAERARLIATEQQVFTDTINAYVGVVEAQNLLALNISNEQVLTRQLQATNDRFRVGEITRTDVAQAEAALAGARAQRETAAGNVQTARATFAREVGVLPPPHLIDPQPVRLPVTNEQEAMQFAVANNPNVIAALFSRAAAKDAMDVAFSSLMPTVSAQASYVADKNQAQQHEQTTGGLATLNFTVPIYQGGSEYAAVRQARQNEEQATRAVDDARRAAIQQAVQAWETLVAARATITSTRAAITANEIALEGVQREAIVGSRTTQDVLNAQQQLLNSQVTLVQNLTSYVEASYNVIAAIGRLTARDFNLPVPLYDDTAYYNAVRDRLWGTGDYATNQPGR